MSVGERRLDQSDGLVDLGSPQTTTTPTLQVSPPHRHAGEETHTETHTQGHTHTHTHTPGHTQGQTHTQGHIQAHTHTGAH